MSDLYDITSRTVSSARCGLLPRWVRVLRRRVQSPWLLLQMALQYYFGLRPLGVFEVADSVYGLNFNTVAAILKAPEVVQVLPPAPVPTPSGVHCSANFTDTSLSYYGLEQKNDGKRW